MFRYLVQKNVLEKLENGNNVGRHMIMLDNATTLLGYIRYSFFLSVSFCLALSPFYLYASFNTGYSIYSSVSRVRDNMCIGGAPSSMPGMLLKKISFLNVF